MCPKASHIRVPNRPTFLNTQGLPTQDPNRSIFQAVPHHDPNTDQEILCPNSGFKNYANNLIAEYAKLCEFVRKLFDYAKSCKEWKSCDSVTTAT